MMDKKILIILHVVSGLFLLILGGGMGIFYQTQKAVVPPKEVPKVEAVQKLSSKVIPSITAYGTITNIDGRNVTLTFGGDSLTVKIWNDAKIYLPATSTKDSKGNTVVLPQQTAKFADIKKGDNVSIILKLLPDGQIEGQLVIIYGAK